GISPAQVGLVEAHGTGTIVGDRTELQVLTDVYTTAGAPTGSCTLGSVKSQIGHTKCTAGITGLIKAACAVHTGVRPPTSQLNEPNPYWDPESSPFSFEASAQPWTSPETRTAAVSAFGFGGTNFHTVLSAYEGAPEPRHGLQAWPAELYLFRGDDHAAATAPMNRLAGLLAANDSAGRPWRLRDLAWSCSQDQSHARVWAAIVAENLDDLATKLAQAQRGTPAQGVYLAPEYHAAGAVHESPRVAFLFPGQGSQRPQMLAELFVAFPRLRRFLELGERWTGAMFPPAAFSEEESTRQRATLTDTRVAQPALGITGLAMHELLSSLGVHPDHLGGHSYGELVALTAAGAMEAAALLELSEARGQAILTAAGSDPGTMAAVTASPDQIRAVLRDTEVSLANHNAPGQTVISGPTLAVQAALNHLAEAGLSGTRLPVACAFHSPLVAGATPLFAAELERRAISTPRLPVWSNSTARPYPAEPAAIRATLAAHVAQPVRFVEQIEAMYSAGVRVFIETGPGRVLTNLAATILAGRPHTAVATNVPGEPGLGRLLRTLAELAVTGVPVDPTELFHGRSPRPDPALIGTEPAPARRPGWTVNGHRVATTDGVPLSGGLRPAQQVPMAGATPDHGNADAAGRDAAVREFLRTTRELIAAQREIMLGYLGSTTPAAHVPTVAAPPAPAQPTPVHTSTAVAPPQPDRTERVEPAELTPESVLATVRSLVSERTGYPEDMLQADLDLEADLSIDSIKRTELIGLLTDRLGLSRSGGAPTESVAEELAKLRTLRGIVDWITNRTSTPHHATPTRRLRRYLIEAAILPHLAGAPHASLEGQRIAIVGDGVGIALELSELLERRGAQVRLLAPDHPTGMAGTDTVIYLAALDRGRGGVLPEGFSTLRDAVVGGVRQLLVITGSGGRFARSPDANGLAGIGLPGLVRTIAHEFPDRRIRVIDVDPKQEPDHIAAYLLAELLAPDAPTAVGCAGGERISLQPIAAPLATHSPAELPLGPESVVLLTGGARGITAQVAIGLARASGCHLELIGRTPAPAGDEDLSTAAATDRIALRRVLAQESTRTPAQIETMTSRILAEREIRATLRQLTGLAASVRYTAVDVQIPEAVTALVKDVYQRHGRLDGIVHGAGILADRLVADKTPEEFARVWATKVEAARALAGSARADLSFLVLFGSVSGVFGNRGQADYAAANDALDTLAHIWASRSHGRVLTVDWGPWAAPEGGTGMVTAELARHYDQCGIELIQPEEGVACLLAELAGGTDPQVLYLAGDPAAFEAGRDG
ncbi:MAG TPA: SDR family NAD(P)-dependent oxidoreductase, partial [Pseudonocardiaceae bacterium]